MFSDSCHCFIVATVVAMIAATMIVFEIVQALA